MKKNISILLLFAYLFSTTELHQLLKLPLLFSHYIEHSNKKSNLSFSDYLKDHYSDENDNNSPDKKDQKLPFKSHKDCVVISDVSIPPMSLFKIIKSSIYFKKQYPITRDCDLNSADLSSIWQPPKI